MEGFQSSRNKGKVSLDKRCVFLLGFMLIVLPVIVGVVVWYITDSSCLPSDDSGSNTGIVGDSDKSTLSPISTTEGNNDLQPWRNLRLPETVVPIHYDVDLYPDFYGNHGWFYGNETVELDIRKATNVILIHANFLNITRTVLRDANGGIIPIQNTFWYEENQFWVVQTTVAVPVSRVFLGLQFDGSLTRAIVGFYKSSYVNSITKELRHLASSKFQPVDARRAFPCFDEPQIKAEYTIRLIHQPGYTALSNMPAESTSPWIHDASLHRTNFQRSVKMSTYLVCFVVCDFAMLNDTTKYNTEIRVFATPDRIDQAAYSLKIMKISMEEFEGLFKVKFPLPKNDMIAIPDFVSGAMEHWGLITYREVNMLYDSNEASAANKQRVAKVVSHEIAHMWFGNIVTMKWWDDLWLNEGFASFVAPIGVDAAEPEWHMLDQMVVDDVQPVMVTDAGVNSHPIVVDVSHPDQITEVFDAISYSKGASVIRMLRDFVGSDKFFSGIERYLVDFEWGAATTKDLWDRLGQVPAGYSVGMVMDTWTRQMGLPYINISVSSTGTGQSTITAVQQRLLADKDMTYDPTESPYGYMWYIQLDYTTDSGRQVQWITKEQRSITFDIDANLDDSSTLVKFNVNQTGFYRVNYPENIWRRFAALLLTNGPSQIPSAVDRAGLLDDAFNMARGGYIGYDVAMGMTQYLDQERDHLPWDSAYNGINYLLHMFENSGKFNALRLYFNTKIRPVMRQLTWNDGTSHLDKMMRSNLIRLSCEFADNECLGNATQKFRDWLDTGAKVSPNVRTYVYKYGMRTGGSDRDWETMWVKYTNETVPQERDKLLYGLAQTRDAWLLNRYLEYCKDQNKVRAQDFFIVVSYIGSNPVGRGLAWDWIRSNWEYLLNRFTIGSRSLGRLVPSVVRYFNTPFKLHEVEEFFQKYPDGGAGARGRVQLIEVINRNIAWMNNYSDDIEAWLLAHI